MSETSGQGQRLKSGLLTLGALVVVGVGFGLFGGGSVTGHATGSEGAQAGCGGAYHDADSGQLVEGIDGPNSVGALTDIKPFVVKPDVSDGLMDSDFVTEVSTSSSGKLVAISFAGILDEEHNQVKLVQLSNRSLYKWSEIATVRLAEFDIVSELDTAFQVIEDKPGYATFLSGSRVVKFFKADESWYTLKKEEIGPYLAGVGKDDSTRLFRELSELKPVTVGSHAIKEVVNSVMSADVNINVSNYSYVATKVVAVALDIGAAIIFPDCAMGYRLEVSGDVFKCEVCPVNSDGEPDCSFDSSQSLEEESAIPKPKDVFVRLEALKRVFPSPGEPDPGLVDPKRKTFP